MQVKKKASIVKLNYYLQKKSSLVVFLLILMGVVLPTISEAPFESFFQRLYAILTNPYFNMFFFFAAGLSVIYMKNEFSRSYNFVSRSKTYKELILKFLKDIAIQTIFLYFVAIILSIAGAAIFCLGEYGFVNHPKYEFNLLYYLCFFCIRSIVIAILINIIIYLLSNLLKNKFTMLLILIFNIGFLVIMSSKEIIHFYNMGILYHYYFMGTSYVSFWIEILCSVLEILLLIIVINVVYRIITNKKRDII